MRRMLVAALATFAGLAGSAGPADASEAAPDVLLSAAANSRANIAEAVESMVLPQFDFRRMTRLAMARDWRRASPEQQNALVAEFRTLLMRTYATALANQGDQAIEYKLLRVAPGETGVTVRAALQQPGAERMTFDYDMEKTTEGWRVCEIRIDGASLTTIYRSTFARSVHDGGVDGLIKTLSARNRQADAELRSNERGALPVLIMYAMMTTAVRGGR